jgi:TRAP transporter TAXI family solute receptor
MKRGSVSMAVVSMLILGLGGILFGLADGAQSATTELPKRIVIATHPFGSMFNMMGTGVAEVISKNSPMKAIVKATGGTSAWLPLMESKEVDLGIIGGLDVYDAYYGIGEFQQLRKGKGFNVCLLQMGSKSYQSIVVRDDSSITSIAGLKGKKVAWGFPSHLAAVEMAKGTLNIWGIREQDFTKVVFNDIFEGTRAVGDGIVDACWISPEATVVREIDSRKRLRFLDYWPTIDPEVERKMQPFLMGNFLEIRKAGPAIRKDTIFTVGQVALAVRKDLDDEVVYWVAKTLWENYAKLGSFHPTLTTWIQQTMVTAKLRVPYHLGAVRFYKEVGAWTPQMEKHQEDVLTDKK